jgi:hypothetical protein
MAFPVSISFNARDNVSPAMRKMNKGVTRFSRNSRRSFRGVGDSLMRMKSLIAGAGAALATGAIARGINQFAQAGDDVGKTARQLGVGVEALQELRFAAERQGVTVQNLDKSLKAMNNRLGLLRNEQGQLNTLLEDTNPQLREQLVNTESSEEAFMLLMNAMDNAGSTAERTALAQAAFSSSGRELVRMSEAGVDGLNALRQEAQATGMVMSEDATKAGEAFQDQMTNLKSVLTGLRNTALTPLIKDLTPLIEQTSEWIKQNKELIALKIQETFDTIKRTVDALIRAWDSGLIPAIIAGVAAFKTLLPIAMGISKLTGAITTAKGAMAGLNLVMAANPVGAVVAVIAGLVGVITLLWNRSEKFRNTIKGAWEILKQVATAGPRLIGKVAGFLGFGGSGGQATSANAGQNQRTVTENRSQLDVNLAGLPQGSTVRQRGNAPGIGVNYGFAQGGL